MKLNVDYRICEREDIQYNIIELKGGKYAGVMYNYREVVPRVLNEGQINETFKLSFSWDLIEGDECLKNDRAFDRHIGQVLESVLHDSFEKNDYKIGGNDGKS